MAYIGAEPNPGQNREVDDISSGFNGNATAFTLQVNSQNVSPGSSNAIIVSLGGVVQNPGTDYTVAASTLTFTTAPASGLAFFGLVLGQQVDTADANFNDPVITGDLSIADKIVHTGDTNNAIRFPAADTITAETNGSERVRVDANGAFHVKSAGTAYTGFTGSGDAGIIVGNGSVSDAGLQIRTGTSGTCRVNFGDGEGSSSDRSKGFIHYLHSNNSMGIGTNSSQRVTIDSSGKVGIGTTSPSTMLDVVRSTDNAITSIITNNGQNGGNCLKLSSGGTGGGTAIFSVFKNNQVSEKEVFRIDGGGFVGIGVESHNPLTALHVQVSNGGALRDALTITNQEGNSGTEVGMVFECGADEVARISAKNEGSDIGPLLFSTASSQGANPSEKMRISPDGGIFLGGLTGNVTASTGRTCFRNLSDNRRQLMLGTTSQGARALIEFFNPNGGVGSINTTGSNTAYNTNSDYRLKENVVALSDGITRLKTLKPSRFNFKSDATITVDGFLAHEVTAVPEAITGEKDAVVTQALVDSGDNQESELGNPIYQQIDQSKLVPLLVAAVQELITKVEVLEGS